MLVVFNHAISTIKLYPKKELRSSFLRVVADYKRFVGYKYWIIPIWEKMDYAVIDGWPDRFLCKPEDYSYSETYIENNKIYYNPYCIISTNDGKQTRVMFETTEELNSYVEDLKSQAPHIIIEK